MLTENEKQGLIHRLLSEYTYYRIDLADGWGHISHSFAANIRKIGTRKPSVFEFYVKTPSPQVAYGADILYERTMRHLRFKDFLHQDNVLNVLRKHIIDCEESRKALVDDDLDPVYYWTDEMDEKIEILGKNIEDIKIKLYKNADATKQRIERIRKDLKISQDKYNYLYERKHLFNDRTAEFIASKIYFRYLYNETLYDTNYKRIKGLPYSMLDAIANIVDINRISSSSIRELSHTFPWSSYYQTIKANPFTPSQLTGDLLSLLQFSRWYEWVRQHPDCPDSKIIDDDDMIDGWFLLKEREKPVKDSNLVEAGDRNVEKFYIAHTQEEADDIYRRNNRGAASIIYNRTKQLAEHGPTIDSNLNDVKFDGMVRANNLANSKR